MAAGEGQNDQGQDGVWMYHVTNVSAQDPRPDWHEIKPCSIANDKTYDGDLLGLPLASFTTTRYDGGHRDMPTRSPYPRNHDQTGKHHRVRLNFNIDDHHIYLMSKTKTERSKVTQVQLLCIKKEDRNKFEDEVYNILSKHYPNKRLIRTQEQQQQEQQQQQHQQEERPQLDTYIPNTYSQADKRFVNVHFIYPIPIPHDNRDDHWDHVTKNAGMGTRAGVIDKRFTDIRSEDLHSLWCIQHYYKEIKDKVENLKQNHNVLQLLKDHQSQSGLTSAMDELTRAVEEMNI